MGCVVSFLISLFPFYFLLQVNAFHNRHGKLSQPLVSVELNMPATEVDMTNRPQSSWKQV